MKLKTVKTYIWLIALVTIGTTVALAQTSGAQTFASTQWQSGGRGMTSVLGRGKSLEIQAPDLLTASNPLPDAPSAIVDRQSADEPPRSSMKATATLPPPATKVPTGFPFWVANGVLLGSAIANAEMIANCRPSACQVVPDALRTRAALYGIGIPASIGISYISYKLKRSGTKMWIVPVVVFAAGNIVYAIHASEFSR